MAGDGQPQGVASPAGAVAFVERGLIRGAHGAALTLATDARAVAHLDRAVESVGVGVVEEGADALGDADGPRRGLHAQSLRDALDGPGLDDVAGVEQVVRVEEGLDLAEGVHEFRAVETLEQRAADAPVAVLARHHAPERLGQVRRLDGDGPHPLAVGGVVDVDQRPHVEHAHRGVRVEGRPRAVPGHDVAQSLHERREVLDGNGVVLDEGDGLARPRHAVQQRLAGLAELPRVEHRLRVDVELPADAGRPGPQGLETRRDPRGLVREVLDIEHGLERHPLGGGHQVDVAPILGVGAGQVDHRVVEQFHRRGVGLEDRRHRRDGLVERREAEHRQPLGRGLAVQLGVHAQRHGQRALAAAEQVREVHLVDDALGHGLAVAPARPLHREEDHVEPVARVATHRLGEALADQRGVTDHDVAHAKGQAPRRRIGRPALEPHATALEPRRHQRDVEPQHVLAGAAVANRPCARGVVAHATPEGRVPRRGRVGREEPAAGGDLVVEVVDGAARLDERLAADRIEPPNVAAPRREVDDHGVVRALPRQTRPPAPGQHRHPATGRPLDHGRRVLDIGGNHHAHGLHLIERGVGGVEHAIVLAETNLATHQCGKFPGQLAAGVFGDVFGRGEDGQTDGGHRLGQRYGERRGRAGREYERNRNSPPTPSAGRAALRDCAGGGAGVTPRPAVRAESSGPSAVEGG